MKQTHGNSGTKIRIAVVFRRAVLLLFIVAAIVGSRLALKSASESRKTTHTEAGVSPLTGLEFCTNPAATAPQIPFWEALHMLGLEKDAIKTVYWKTPGQLQALLLAGKGDIWLGHVEGFARARSHGAPVVLLAVTGWRKMSILSCDPNVLSQDDLWGKSLPYAPFGSPAVPAMIAMTPPGSTPPLFLPHEPKQLAAKIASRKINTALLPEPLVTIMLRNNPDLRIIATLEEMHSRHTGGPARIPWAGIAVHERLMTTHREAFQSLLLAMKNAARALDGNPVRAADALPAEFAEFIPKEIVAGSLERDLILVEDAADVSQEIESYLRLAAPEVVDESGEIPILKTTFLGGSTPGR